MHVALFYLKFSKTFVRIYRFIDMVRVQWGTAILWCVRDNSDFRLRLILLLASLLSLCVFREMMLLCFVLLHYRGYNCSVHIV